jgi:glycosyltransferase involved in cell wall biosynthesis
VPHAAAGSLLDEVRPDVVVAESMDATTWGPLRSLLADRRVPVVLSIHERASVARLDGTVPAPELVFVNAEVHANAVRTRGHDAVLVPSLVERPATPPGADASQVLFVNPIPGYGAEVAWALAAARPNTTFTFAESWPLVPPDVRALGRRARRHPNVHVHRLRPQEQLYRDAAVLLVPYLDDNRPRVVTEAQLLGIPVLARDTPALRESVAGGGRLVDGGAPAGAWGVALDELVAMGPSGPRPHREGEQPEVLAARVEALLTELVGS